MSDVDYSHAADIRLWERVRARVKVFDCFDENAHFFAAGSREARKTQEAEERALRHADLVLASAPRLRPSPSS